MSVVSMKQMIPLKFCKLEALWDSYNLARKYRKSHGLYINHLTLKISLVILLIVCHTIHIMLVWRIWNWINQ